MRRSISLSLVWPMGCLWLPCLTAACASSPNPAVHSTPIVDETENLCRPAATNTGSSGPVVLTGGEPAGAGTADHAQPAESSLLSPRAQQIASIIGVQPVLEQIPALQAEAARGDPGAVIRLLSARRRVSDRLLLALVEADSVTAELDCERARAEDLAVQLEERQNDIQQRRTVTAIVGESALQMAAGLLLVLGIPEAAGGAQIAGNSIALTFGTAALGGAQQAEAAHARNLLGDVWEGPEESVLFPAALWRFLNQPQEDAAGQTKREMILALWRGRLGESGSETEQRRLELFFGRGGRYGVEDLRHRADMLGVLRAFVHLMSQDLNLLLRETLMIMNPERM